MDNIQQIKRYIPHKLTTRYHAVKLYRSGNCNVTIDVRPEG